MSLTDEINELNEMYKYMQSEKYSDNDFSIAAEELVTKGHYTKKALDMFKSIRKIKNKETKSKPNSGVSTSKIESYTDPCSTGCIGGTSRRSIC